MIADTGPIIAWLNSDDDFHSWARSLDSFRVVHLAGKFADHDIDLVDFCVVRLSEKFRREKVATVDSEHFSILRRFQRERIPLILPNTI